MGYNLKKFISDKVDDLSQLELLIKEAIDVTDDSADANVSSRDVNREKYSGPLVTQSGNKRYLGDPKIGLSVAGWWKSFREALQTHINENYEGLNASIEDLGVSRDLEQSIDIGGNSARVAGSKHGAGMAQDVKIHTDTHGQFTDFRTVNPKLAADQKLVDAIITFLDDPLWIDVQWGGAFGSDSDALAVGEAPKGRGILEFHHFEFKGSSIPKHFKDYKEELEKIDIKSSELTTTSKLKDLYTKLAEGSISKRHANYLLENINWAGLIKLQDQLILVEAIDVDHEDSVDTSKKKESQDDDTGYTVDIPEGTEFVHPLPIIDGKDYSTKLTSKPQASRSVKTDNNPRGEARPHKGADFGVPVGTPLLAYADGTITTVTNQPKGAGYYVTVTHGFSASDNITGASGELKTQYMHMSRQDVKVNDKVTAGQVLGLSGGAPGSPGAGNTTGPHLHFTFKIGDKQSYNGSLYTDMLAKATVVNAKKEA